MPCIASRIHPLDHEWTREAQCFKRHSHAKVDNSVDSSHAAQRWSAKPPGVDSLPDQLKSCVNRKVTSEQPLCRRQLLTVLASTSTRQPGIARLNFLGSLTAMLTSGPATPQTPAAVLRWPAGLE